MPRPRRCRRPGRVRLCARRPGRRAGGLRGLRAQRPPATTPRQLEAGGVRQRLHGRQSDSQSGEGARAQAYGESLQPASLTPCLASNSPTTPGRNSLCFCGGPTITCSTTRDTVGLALHEGERKRQRGGVERQEHGTASLHRAPGSVREWETGALTAVKPHARHALVQHSERLSGGH